MDFILVNIILWTHWLKGPNAEEFGEVSDLKMSYKSLCTNWKGLIYLGS